MSYDLLIRQSYHGNGGKDGYRFKVYNHKKVKLGEIKDLPATCSIGDLVSINHRLYEISDSYDSDNPREKGSEVVYFELQLFEPHPDHDLGEIF